jgi:hypothetical protein
VLLLERINSASFTHAYPCGATEDGALNEEESSEAPKHTNLLGLAYFTHISSSKACKYGTVKYTGVS